MSCQVKEYYNRYHTNKPASIYFNIKGEKTSSPHYRHILDLMRVEKAKIISDIGCGSGELLTEAKKRGLICHGVDISEEALKAAKSKTEAYYICADIELGLFYPNEYFDYVTCLGVWEHFKNQESVLREMVRILKKTGKMCIFVPNKNYILHKLGYETDYQPVINRYSLDEYIEKLEKAGVFIDKILKNNFHLSNLNESFGYIKHFIKLLIHPFLIFLPLRLSYHFIFICSKQSYYSNR